MTRSVLMNPLHPDWERFCELLEGSEGCDFKESEPGNPKSVTWQCEGGHSQVKARQILARHFPDIDADRSCELFSDFGGHCDCEILFNVEARARHAKPSDWVKYLDLPDTEPQ